MADRATLMGQGSSVKAPSGVYVGAGGVKTCSNIYIGASSSVKTVWPCNYYVYDSGTFYNNSGTVVNGYGSSDSASAYNITRLDSSYITFKENRGNNWGNSGYYGGVIFNSGITIPSGYPRITLGITCVTPNTATISSGYPRIHVMLTTSKPSSFPSSYAFWGTRVTDTSTYDTAGNSYNWNWTHSLSGTYYLSIWHEGSSVNCKYEYRITSVRFRSPSV